MTSWIRKRSVAAAALAAALSGALPVHAQDVREVDPPPPATSDGAGAPHGLAEGEEASRSALAITAGLTPHFRSWLSANGYGAWGFERSDVPGGSTGGRASAGDPIVRVPVVFVHGNSDSALGTGVSPFTGFSATIAELKARGYTGAELYATTWGPASVAASSLQYHSRAHLTRIRAFLEAVLAYTGAPKISIVGHSMGVTLARKAILGGAASDAADGGSYDLGPALTAKVDTFIGISGSNWGLVSCYQTGPTTPTCGSTNGFYPGYWYGPTGLSAILANVNARSRYEGSYVFTIWSTVDEVIGYGDVVWGRYTSQVPGQNGEKRYASAPYGHFGSKDLSTYTQYRMLSAHSLN